MTTPSRPLTILRRGAEPAAGSGCERCAQSDALRRELEEQRRLAQERRLEIVQLQGELQELRRRDADPAAVGSQTQLRGVFDGPSIGEIPVTGRRVPRRTDPSETSA